MPFRLLRYVVRIWERWIRQATVAADGVPPRTLPPVVPFVVHQGPGPWTVARSIADLVPLPAALAPFVRPFLPGLDMSVLDLGAAGPEAIAEWEGSPIFRLTLAAMRSVVDVRVDLLAVLTVFEGDLPAILARPDGREAFAVLMRYIVRKSVGLDVAALATHLARLAGPEAKEVVMSTAQELIDQGVKQGLEQGEAKGVRETLTRLLVAKFGRLSADVTQRLADASLSDLARWTERLLAAKEIDDVFTRSKASRPRGKRPRGR